MRGAARRWAVIAVIAVVMLGRAAGAVTIGASAVTGVAGQRLAVDVALATEGETVVGTENRIDFTRTAFVAARDDGEPDCAVNPAIRKEATAFRFWPLGCDPDTACTGVLAFVLSFSNFRPIDDGAVLYTCTVQVAADAAPGVYPLALAESRASTPTGVFVPVMMGGGAVHVVLPAAARIVVGEVSGLAGNTVQVEVGLELLSGADVGGVQLDLSFDPVTPIAVGADGVPACRVDPAIRKEATVFVFRPLGCMPGTDCTGLRAFVFSFTNMDPLPDGATLYTCDVDIAAGAAPGTYPLVAGMPGASGPHGEPLLALASDGNVVVEEPPPSPCVGDCDGDLEVGITELLVGVNLLIAGAPPDDCAAFNSDGSRSVTIGELIQAVNNALNGCPDSSG